ncbi:glutamyl-tRNA reductase [Fontimonas thermophila]|uniref:Glutamyl-tRNA reductase n=1 Tax=Fontimonas thermophila TaxID=1076937 RepID=A0A1I2INA7_9GAMM|nr:glutamyl-tRNA reductase [Fontimonas thermophila]SFF43170.1 glutamyl-tRNA reductase [Fontimonas thermophila]
MALLTLGLSHHRAPVEARERLAFTESDLPSALIRLRALPGIDEAAILSTCNRTEIMAVTALEAESKLIEWWRRERQAPEGYIEKYLYTHRDLGSVRHSLRVAAGLDSLVVGEPQILGQMKQTYAIASQVRALGPVLGRLFQHAFAVAKLVRSQTQIGAHPVSVAYAALQMARRIFADLHQQTALLIGAGEMMQLVGRHLHQHGVGRIVVANRSLERAEKLARDLHGYAISLNDLPAYLGDADLIVSSTAARGYIIDRDTMQRAVHARRRKPVFMIDLAVPRDIDPRIADLEDIYLYSIDDLRDIVAENLKLREEAARQAEVLVQTQAEEFARWLESRDAASTIQAIRARARASRDEVLDKARRRLAAGEPAEDVLAFVADTLSNKILHAPSQALRRADAVEQALLLNAARRLFDLPED